MDLKDIIGQFAAKEHLIQAVQDGRVANTQLFLGASGYGTLAMALAYANYLLCSDRGPTGSCGKCGNCVMMEKLEHPDLHFSFPIFLSEKNKVSDPLVEEWRKTVLKDPYLNAQDWYTHLGNANKQGVIGSHESANILKKLQLRSFSGGYKIMLIWLPETMNPTAANKLLKMLEEPSKGTVSILVTNEIEQLLPTIISRTQVFKVPRLTTANVASGLAKYNKMPEEECQAIAMRSEGDLNAALKEARDQNGAQLDLFRKWMRICFKKDVLSAIDLVDEIYRSGKEGQKALLRYGLHVSRQCLVYEHSLDELVNSIGQEKVFVEKVAQYLNSDIAMVLQEEFNKAYSHLERNANAKILFMDLTFTMFKNIGK